MPDRGSAAEVLRAFLGLGLRSFGGPIAHIGYFHREFVERRGWLDDARFAQLIAVCQFLPGPASSQIGFAIGLLRAGLPGALAAFVGFTLPSALLMLAFATAADVFADGSGAALMHGLKLVAVCVVAWGLLSMARRLTPDLRRVLLAAAACALLLVWREPLVQLLAIAAGGLLGAVLLRNVETRSLDRSALPIRWTSSAALLVAYGGLLVLSFAIPANDRSLVALWAAFYRAGALVFGGGHVVLPLLEESVVSTGWLDLDTFLAGYGAAQAVPGPMFSVAAYLGAMAATDGPASAGAVIALAGIFLPGFLLLLAVLPVWNALTRIPAASRAVAGVNAAVVGLLAAALYDPIATQGIASSSDVLIVAIGFAVLAVPRANALWVVLWCVGASVGVAALG